MSFFARSVYVCVCVRYSCNFSLSLARFSYRFASFPFDVGSSWWWVRCWRTPRNIISGIICGRRGFFVSSSRCVFSRFVTFRAARFALNWSSASPQNFISEHTKLHNGVARVANAKWMEKKRCERSKRCAHYGIDGGERSVFLALACQLALKSCTARAREREKCRKSAHSPAIHAKARITYKRNVCICGKPTGVNHLNRRFHWYIAWHSRAVQSRVSCTVLNSVFVCAFLIVFEVFVGRLASHRWRCCGFFAHFILHSFPPLFTRGLSCSRAVRGCLHFFILSFLNGTHV